jgi:hypothetical protein
MLRVWLLVSAFCLTLSGCATAPPVEQVRAFANASDAFNAASQPLLDELAVSERARAWRLIKDPPKDAKNVLDVPLSGSATPRRLQLDLPIDQVLAISTIGDPPATAELRKGVGTIKHYAAVLVLLAENQNVEAARAELGILAANVTGVVALIPGAQAGTALISPSLTALQPLIDSAVRAQNAAELRLLVVNASPKIKELNAALRSSIDPMFHATASGDREIIIGGQVDPAAAVDRIDAYRVSFANWLMLLGLVDQATDQLAAAVSNPSNAVSLGSLAELSTRITTYAEGTRRALAVFRTDK